MFNIVLYQPEIPPNTGNIIRLAANTGAHLHLIKPLGFALDEKRLRRAGLDYHEWANVTQHASLMDCLAQYPHNTVWAATTKGKTCYTSAHYQPNDILLFGPETRGLPVDILLQLPETQKIYIPMQPHSRSINLSNAVAVILYEALRQQDFNFR